MGYDDDERRMLKLQATYEAMEMITQGNAIAAAILTALDMFLEQFDDIPDIIRRALFGTNAQPDESIRDLTTDLIDLASAEGMFRG